MKRTAKTLEQLKTLLVHARVREFDVSFIERMQARKDVARLTAAIKRKEKQS